MDYYAPEMRVRASGTQKSIGGFWISELVKPLSQGQLYWQNRPDYWDRLGKKQNGCQGFKPTGPFGCRQKHHRSAKADDTAEKPDFPRVLIGKIPGLAILHRHGGSAAVKMIDILCLSFKTFCCRLRDCVHCWKFAWKSRQNCGSLRHGFARCWRYESTNRRTRRFRQGAAGESAG